MKNKTQLTLIAVLGLLVALVGCAKNNDERIAESYYSFMITAIQSEEFKREIEKGVDMLEFMERTEQMFMEKNKISGPKLRKLVEEQKGNTEIATLSLKLGEIMEQVINERRENRRKIDARKRQIGIIERALQKTDGYMKSGSVKEQFTEEEENYLDAMAFIADLGNTLHWRFEGKNEYPKIEKIADLGKLFDLTIPDKDPWGNEYQYKQTEAGYWIGCAGSDGVFQGFDQAGLVPFQSGADIVFSNGKFSFAPRVLE